MTRFFHFLYWREKALRLGIFFILLVAYTGRNKDLLPFTPFTEDGFYLLSIVRNMSRGLGISYDGLTLTNGIQPLIAFVLLPVYWIFGDNPENSLRAVIFVQIIIFGLSTVLAGKLSALLAPQGQQKAARIAGAWMWLVSYPLFRHSVNGLETGLYLLLMLAFGIRHFSKASDTSTKEAVLDGVLLGFIVLARVDAAILVAIYFVWSTLKFGLKYATLQAGFAALVSSPWWLRNKLIFGSFMPISGKAQMFERDIFSNLVHSLSGLAQPMSPVLLPVSLRFSSVFAFFNLFALSLFWFFLLRRASGDWGRTGRPRWKLADWLPLIGFGFGLFIFYTFEFAAGHFNERYLIIISAFLVPFLSVILVGAVKKPKGFAQKALAAIGAMIGVVVLFEQMLTVTGSPKLSGSPHYSIQTHSLAERIPVEAKVAAFQSGTLGYFRPGTVNLDGKVNYEALLARQNNELWKYVLKIQAEYIIDWPNYVDLVLGPLKKMNCFAKVEEMAGFEVWKRRDCVL